MKKLDEQYHALQDVFQFEEVFRKYRMRCILFAKSYVKDDVVAEDITMDAFTAFLEKCRESSEINNPYPYILTIIKSLSLNHLKHQRTIMQVQEQMNMHELRELNFRISTLKACEPEELFSSEIREIIGKTLETIPEQSRRIFMFSRIENKSHKEIAQIMNISTKAVEFHITKVLKKLRISLKDYILLLLLLRM
ncbi:MAG: RNA polymerase sigma-70 factor [Dysgonamonadaceae bacterium]|jgi:RNA polymerase sigma-70 factor (ECF subfamily)|nr:RNA polymerase sigma-70 factor [Dysgonamonadaceae bacterium]